MARKISETLNAFPAGVWVLAANYFQFCGVGFVQGGDQDESVTVQLRKALDGDGTGATNFGAAVTVTADTSPPAADVIIKAAADGRSDELGRNDDGVPYTHVSVLITGDASPETSEGFLLAGDARFSNDTLSGLGLAGR